MGNFRAPSKLFYNILAPEKQAKKLNLQENSAPQKKKSAHNQPNTSTQARILCGRQRVAPPPPYAKKLTSTFEKCGICNDTFSTRAVLAIARIKNQPRQPSCTVIRAYIKKNLISYKKLHRRCNKHIESHLRETFASDTEGIESIRTVSSRLKLVFFSLGKFLTSLILTTIIHTCCLD